MQGYYHCSVDIISRGKGRSAVACAAYRSGMVLHDQRYGRFHDYGRRKGIVEAGVLVPDGAPTWATEREALWNSVESFERRKDAQLAREFVLGLPCQLDHDQRRELVETFIRREFTSQGLIADWAIHAPNEKGDDRNHHAHVMVTLRSVSSEGFAEHKDRSFNARDQLRDWRESWADIQNQAFERHGVVNAEGRPFRVDHRSYEDQGQGLEPTVHLGVHATAMERAGKRTDLGDMNRSIHASNDDRRMHRRVSQFITSDDQRQMWQMLERLNATRSDHDKGDGNLPEV